MVRVRRQAKGFTLIELMVVILIIAMLGTFVAPNVMSKFRKAKADLARPRMAVIEDALKHFELDCGRLPEESEGGLDALTLPEAPPGLEGKYQGPYLKKSQLLDPWGNPYQYIREGQANPGSFDLVSFGADGQQGGEGENADIVND
jgi:general secretion pathway protein G